MLFLQAPSLLLKNVRMNLITLIAWKQFIEELVMECAISKVRKRRLLINEILVLMFVLLVSFVSSHKVFN